MHPTLELSELDVKIGQLFMAGIPNTKLDSGTEILIRDFCLGGIILFSRNIDNPLQIAALCNDLQDCSKKYHNIPLFLAVDQEGGRVARLGKPFTAFPGNPRKTRPGLRGLLLYRIPRRHRYVRCLFRC